MPRSAFARKLRQVAVLVALSAALAGCPKRFDPRVDPVRRSPDPAADDAYRLARARLDAGEHRQAEELFARFLEEHPEDPLAPSARLQRARAVLALGETARAKELLEPMAGSAEAIDPADPVAVATRARARYLLGQVLYRSGELGRARELLAPFESQIASGDDKTELHAILAACAIGTGDADEALRQYGLYFQEARPAERLFIRDRVGELVAGLSLPDAERLWASLPHDGIGAAFLGPKLAAVRQASGDQAGARQLLGASRGARERVGLGETRGERKEVRRLVGCLLPLSGRGRAIGERALRGALLGADLLAPEGAASGRPLELHVRDTGSDPARVAELVDELVAEGVAAILASPDRLEAQMAVPRAEELGVPLLELAPDDVRRSDGIFKLVRARTQVAVGLARRVVKDGARSIAVLAPDSAYGRSMAQAFVEAAKAAGARVTLDLRYPTASTTFVQPVRRIAQIAPDALFVPAPASQLALIAPQLASSGVTALAGIKSVRSARLYATADGLSERILQQTAKYLEGATLAPVYYADPAEERAAQFVERYRAAFGEEPSSVDALAFDGVGALRRALDRGDVERPSRGALKATLGHQQERGLTGAMSFGLGGERQGLPRLYVIEAGEVRGVDLE